MEHLNQQDHEEQRERWLHDLMAIDFVLLELNLYLDTHPRDQQAIQQFNEFVTRRAKLATEYERHYGPLMNFGHSLSPSPWAWNDGPWPWQM
jgi:spore coat protein JB